MYGLKKFWFQVVDLNGDPVIDNLGVTIRTTGGAVATVYSDAQGTSLTNPIVETVFDDDKRGVVEFWGAGTTYEIEVKDELGRAVTVEGFTGRDHRIVFDPHSHDSVLAYANTAAGAELADVSGTFVDYPHSYTLDASKLRVGDVVQVKGMVLCADFHNVEELDIKVLFGTEAILQTGDLVIAANDDVIAFDLYCTVQTEGSGGKLKVEGVWYTDLNGTVVTHIKSPTGSAKEVAEDLSGDCVIKVQGDYATAHADQESYLIDLKVWVHRRGNV